MEEGDNKRGGGDNNSWEIMMGLKSTVSGWFGDQLLFNVTFGG